ncbi:MAG: STAS/SEC14 domain-containing protein [bacterium]|nr:STAS/SEC14 domain-containing protein [bacterium]
MEKGKKEFFIGENRLYLGEDKILYADFSGELTVDIINSLYDFFNLNKTKMMNEGKVKILIHLKNPKKSSPEARKLTYTLSKDKNIGKVALLGINPVTKVIASFFMGNSRKKDVKFFNTKESAIVWLKE